MQPEKLQSLRIDQERKRRPRRAVWTIFIVVAAATLGALYLARPRPGDNVRVLKSRVKPAAGETAPGRAAGDGLPAGATNRTGQVAGVPDDVVLTVSGYIINRERIEISPRFIGVVKWIGVKKGDVVTNGQVVVLLDDSEHRARLAQAEGAVAVAKANLKKAELWYERVNQLAATNIESRQAQDDARQALEAARAALQEAEGARQLAQTYLDWCTIRSPIDGVVLERLVDPNELVVPQSFGGARGPSTAFLAVADPKDLQVEIDVNEADLSKIFLNQRCRVSPEAYPDKTYAGYVAEIAPEADRAKGTLQIKVQIVNPDKYLTPELTAKVDFLKP